jgi:mannose/cellobiose epimerase-like protein (N-acyl-D-glucosamine 2-epimerase family)
MPDFRSPDFLIGHVQHTLAFYDGRSLDPSGGFFHFFKDDGTVYDRRTRHLVSSTRFVFNNATAWRRFGRPEHLAATRHGLEFLQRAHAHPQGGYLWELDWHEGRAQVRDGTHYCYGLAFVLLAHAHAAMAGVDEARAGIESTWQLLERHFWEPRHQLYANEATADWAVSPYRGQNANMHACEAMMAAFEATGDAKYLDRAATLAQAIALRQADLTGGRVWEHFHEDWSVDADHNRGNRADIFKPWGFQTGHLTEWAKLLLQLEGLLAGRGVETGWMLPRAQSLFEAAMRHGWDAELGGLVYGFDPRARSTTATSTSGCRPRASRPPRCSRCAPASRATGTGTTGSGTTPGGTWSTTSMARGFASCRATTASSATRRARPARPTTTRWAPATTCCARSAPEATQNTDSPVRATNISSAFMPSSELPVASSAGDHTLSVSRSGTTATMPPPTPLLQGRPIEKATSPAAS